MKRSIQLAIVVFFTLSPAVYIIAGPNGAGKTTFAREFLPHYADCRNFVNADLIATGMSPFSPEAAAFRAGRLMLHEIELLARRASDFSFETTLSGRSQLALIHNLKRRGYSVHFFFLWLASVEIALARIKGRVERGGHDVAADIVRRRFERSLTNFFRLYRPLSDMWLLFDNSGEAPQEIASGRAGSVHIIRKELFERLAVSIGS